jgi:hypothetical protein
VKCWYPPTSYTSQSTTGCILIALKSKNLCYLSVYFTFKTYTVRDKTLLKLYTVCLAGPLYRMHCSSTASGVANMYSFSNPNSLATTPLDSALANSRLLVDLEPVVAHSMSPTETRTTMTRGHTFSRDARSSEMDLHVSEFGEVNDRVQGTRTDILSPEPPRPYNSSVDEQHPDRTVQVLRWIILLIEETNSRTRQVCWTVCYWERHSTKKFLWPVTSQTLSWIFVVIQQRYSYCKYLPRKKGEHFQMLQLSSYFCR